MPRPEMRAGFWNRPCLLGSVCIHLPSTVPGLADSVFHFKLRESNDSLALRKHSTTLARRVLTSVCQILPKLPFAQAKGSREAVVSSSLHLEDDVTVLPL